MKSKLHNARNETTRLELLEEDVGKRLKDRVGDEEYAQCSIISAGGQRVVRNAQTLLKTINLGIANIGTV